MIALYSAALFSAAFLLSVLPFLGGSPSVWNLRLVFFPAAPD